MKDDYRNTCYCPEYEGINEKKQKLVSKIKKEHPRAIDMHAQISPNKNSYKDDFMKIYNYKCAYCGISIDIIPRSNFEIDHFIYEKSDRFETKADAGYIENLILACHDCNHDKSSFEFDPRSFKDLYPDEEEIKNTFIRDEDYYIKISRAKKDDPTINAFYDQLHLCSEIHRIDYLLMSMIGLQEKIKDKPEACSQLGLAINKLHTKRNVMNRNE